MTENSKNKLSILVLGETDYHSAWNLQKDLHKKRQSDLINDTLILLEHPPVYTIGKHGKDSHIVADKSFLARHKIDIVHIDRGGDVTFHGPGQLVGYLIFKISPNASVKKFVSTMEEALINTLKHFSITAERNPDYPGVWVDDNKIAALGIRITQGVSMHGFALNVQPDLNLYSGIIACGIQDKGLTSMKTILGKTIPMESVISEISKQFVNLFHYDSSSLISRKFKSLKV